MSRFTRATLTLSALVALGGTGCSVFHDIESAGGVTTTTYDDTLPDSLVEVFAECAEPLVLEPGIEEIDLAGSCDLDDVDGAGPDALLLALGFNGPVDLGGPIERVLYSGEEVIDDFPWPMQNCEVTLDYRVRLDELRLYDLDSRWTTFSGDAALWVDFDFQSWADAVEFRVDYDVDCPSRINEGALNTAFGIAIPSGWRQMSINGLDLDLWIQLFDDGSEVGADLYLDVDLSAIDTDTYLSSLPGDADEAVLAALGFDLANIEDEVEDQLYDALAALPGQVADMINGELPDGHIVCSVSASGGELEVVSDDPGLRACWRLMIP